MGRLSHEIAEARAIARDHTCMCGCDKGCSGFKDEATDPTEKLGRSTSSEIWQQQHNMDVYADPFDVLIATESGAPDGIERRLVPRS